MRLSTPFERIHELVGLIEHEPTINQVVSFLSREIDPYGEVSGVGWLSLKKNGVFEHVSFVGFHNSLDLKREIHVSDDNVISTCLRANKTIFIDIAEMHRKYRNAIHTKLSNHYETGLALPITKSIVLGCAFSSSLTAMEKHRDYFECIRSVLSLWQVKLCFEKQNISKDAVLQISKLTERQKLIVDGIKVGKTNAVIARELGFSESLIRQETIIIYSKLGISGRHEISLNYSESINSIL